MGYVVGIGDVGVNDVQPIGVRSPQTIRVADNRIWVVNPPNATQLEPPVVVQVGTPVVNIAGCVEVHKENARTRNRNKQLVDNDPEGNVVLCDSGAPSFIPIDYQANRLKWETFYGEPPEADGVKTVVILLHLQHQRLQNLLAPLQTQRKTLPVLVLWHLA